jgi:hypothetical protein
MPVNVSIPLKILLKYPLETDEDLPSDGMNTFWRGGIRPEFG